MNPLTHRTVTRWILAAAVPLTLVVTSCVSTEADLGADLADMDEHSSMALSAEGQAMFDVLGESCTFLDPNDPEAHSALLVAFARLMDERNAVDAFDALQSHGSAAGRLWGLVGLARVAPDRFAQRVGDHRDVPDMVFTPEGPATLAALIRRRWPDLLQLGAPITHHNDRGTL